MDKEILSAIKTFNKNIDWLRKNQQSVPNENNLSEWVKLPEALKIMDRSRTWLTSRMIKPEDVQQPMNTHWFLIHGIDWEREGNKLLFKTESLLRLKKELRTLGKMYDQRLSAK